MTIETGCVGNEGSPDPEPGIAIELAIRRAQTIEDLRYDLSFEIPSDPLEPIFGHTVIQFRLTEMSGPVVLDFAPGGNFVTSVSTGRKPSQFQVVNDHIVIPVDELVPGNNTVEVFFQAGDASLNRNPDFMYTLFVPARAHLAFPCFDQPDLKARFTLELRVPADWEAVSNGPEISRDADVDRVHIRYAETQPIPTYLFAFAAGRFRVETAERNGRRYRMFHRETDTGKVESNRNEAFDLHAAALGWLEDYTAIEYPFQKFDFVLIPSFQFGGMEHPGAIFYNQASLFLDESATQNSMLGRASLIAHETAHMWFGNLVTMRWFNDVWVKEVLANFMAAKIINPAFPGVDHDLRFLAAHYPAAYGVDRTEGTHPIRQELANLNEASSLYGAIIYQKAPIVMRQLERILGTGPFQDGLRTYLDWFKFSNATWTELVHLLDERIDLDLAAWSEAWVEEAGRPSIRTELVRNAKGGIERLAFVQSDTMEGRELLWTQQMNILIGSASEVRSIPLELTNKRLELEIATSILHPEFVLPTGGGLAYGGFTLDDRSRRFFLEDLQELADPVTRGAVWITLWEELLEGRVQPSEFLNLALRVIGWEETEQNVELVLGYVKTAYWRFLPDRERQALSARLEQALRRALNNADSSSMKSTYFTAFRSVVLTSEGIAFLERVWRRDEEVPGLTLAENDEAGIALELAVRSVPDASRILDEQLARFKNPDRRARFEFIMPAMSESQETRDWFFESLFKRENRTREPWVLEGVRYLNHPLRATQSQKYLRSALDLLQEIQHTGDIFFPRNWMGAILGGHDSTAAAEVVLGFLHERQDYPIRLRRIILQAADDLFRAIAIQDKWLRLAKQRNPTTQRAIDPIKP